MQRRETSTRDRDFADLWVTSHLHTLSAPELRGHILTVATHRGQSILPMTSALANLPDRQTSYAAMVDRMSYLSAPPERWTEVIDGVVDFIDPLLADEEGRLSEWDPRTLKWG